MPVQTTDFELIKDFLAGNEMAFNELTIRYRQKIYWHARRMTGNHLDADDIVQEVLLVMYKKLSDFKFNSSVYTWIYRITQTRSINLINRRKIKRFVFLDDDESKSLVDAPDFAHDLDTKEKLKRLDKVLQKLPVKQREVFILRNFEQLQYEEIADMTGKSIGGLKANYFHAMDKVTNLMKEEFYEKG